MELSIFWLIFLFIAAILTSIINAVAAVGGGMTLFVIMISLLNYAVVVPVHGIIQVWSSAARVIIFRHDVNWGLMKYFLITYIPSVIVGIFLWRLIIDMSEIQPLIKISIAAYLLLYLANYSIKIRTQNRKRLMLYAGAWSGIISLTAGSPAPVMAPLFMKANFYKEELVGTWALTGVIIHLSKLPLFYFIWDQLSKNYIWLIFLLIIGVVMGTYIGKAILGYISESIFTRILKIVLVFLAAKLIIWDGLRVIIFT